MKFEQLLQIYWSKSFLYAGRTRSFNVELRDFVNDLEFWGRHSKFIFFKRFEIVQDEENLETNLSTLSLNRKKTLNVYLSRILSINDKPYELIKLNIIRLYLIKTFKGKCQALGKPSKGQRTWSNAQNAYKLNKVVKSFIAEVKRNNPQPVKKESKNRKFIKKKVKKTAIKIKLRDNKKKVNFWF